MSAACSTRALDLALRLLRQRQRERHVVAHRHVRIERVVLEHHRDVALLRRHAVHDAAADRDLALPVISSSPAIMRSSVDLPQPDGPTSTQNSPSAIAMSTPRITCVVPNRLWTAGDGHRGHRLLPFARSAYAPSVTARACRARDHVFGLAGREPA